MKRLLLVPALLLLLAASHAQYTLKILVPSTDTSIFLAGNINNWNPAAAGYHFIPDGSGNISLTLKDLAPGSYQFKFTRGSWNKVETNIKGEDIPNREIILHSDTTVIITVDAWKDQITAVPKRHTASAQVHVIDTAFFIPQLHRYRRIWIYLPRSYNTGKNNLYPVLYMQDGQNLFDGLTASFGEWGIDECLDTLQQTPGRDCIIVGIDHGSDKRITEYDPYDNTQYGKGKGDAYAAFLAITLKPFIDSAYRTLKDPQHTYIAGSSLGALIALYTVMKYPATFGAAGIFSPAFWIAPHLSEQLQHTIWNKPHRFYCYAGEKESAHMTSDMDTIMHILKKENEVFRTVNPQGQHSEKYWRQAFPDFYNWLLLPKAYLHPHIR